MARTQAVDFDQRREEIVDRAARLFAVRGFLGTSIAELAAACNVSKSLIYHYFGSKEDVLYEAMATHVDALTVAAQDAVASTTSPALQFRRLAKGFMALYVDAAPRHQVLLNDLSYLPAERRKSIIARQRNLVSIVEAILVELQPELADRKGLLRTRSMLFFGMINWTHTWFNSSGPVKYDEIADMACDMILGKSAPGMSTGDAAEEATLA
jgi:AcrR family transcriptional regulator